MKMNHAEAGGITRISQTKVVAKLPTIAEHIRDGDQDVTIVTYKGQDSLAICSAQEYEYLKSVEASSVKASSVELLQAAKIKAQAIELDHLKETSRPPARTFYTTNMGQS